MIIDQYADLIVQENGWLAATRLGSRGNLKVALVGGVTGLVLGGTSISEWSLGVGKVAVSGFVGGVGSEIMGGDFRSGFVGGAIGSLASAVGSSKALTKTLVIVFLQTRLLMRL